MVLAPRHKLLQHLTFIKLFTLFMLLTLFTLLTLLKQWNVCPYIFLGKDRMLSKTAVELLSKTWGECMAWMEGVSDTPLFTTRAPANDLESSAVSFPRLHFQQGICFDLLVSLQKALLAF